MVEFFQRIKRGLVVLMAHDKAADQIGEHKNSRQQ